MFWLGLRARIWIQALNKKRRIFLSILLLTRTVSQLKFKPHIKSQFSISESSLKEMM